MQDRYDTQTYVTRTYESTDTTNERPLGELFSELTQQARTLITQELELARTEVSQKTSVIGKDVGFMAAGGFVIYAGFLAIMAAIIVGISAWIPMWLSALIVGVVVAVIGYVLLQKGMNDLKNQSLTPEKTTASLKETKEWAQQQVK